MKPHPLVAILAFGASLATAPSKAESLSKFVTVDKVHNYELDLLNAKVGFQIGPQNTVSADQSSKINIFTVSQFGPDNAATASQVGEKNNVHLRQSGVHNFAATGQFGDSNTLNRGYIRQNGAHDAAYASQVGGRNVLDLTQISHITGFPGAP